MFDFVHIGYGKCMSTFLQNVWNLSDNYDLVSGAPLAAKIDGLVEQHRNQPDALQALNLKTDPQAAGRAGRTRVMSSEGFTFSWLTRPELGNYVLLKQKYVAFLLSGLTRRALVLVRSPVSWMRSAHAQLIKQGGSASMAEFVRDYRSVILNNLNLKMLLSFWGEAGVETTVLPIELFRDDEPGFWKHYCELLDAPRPVYDGSGLGSTDSNVSDYGTLRTHAALNRLLETLTQRIEPMNVSDRKQCLQALDLARKWATRRALTDIDAGNMVQLENMLRLDDPPGFLDLRIDPAFGDYLRQYFIEPLSGLPAFEGYAVRYEAELDAVTGQADEQNAASA